MAERPQVLDILARDLQPGDLLGEGEKVVMVSRGHRHAIVEVTITSPQAAAEHQMIDGCFVLSWNAPQSIRHYANSDEVRVIRRASAGEEG